MSVSNECGLLTTCSDPSSPPLPTALPVPVVMVSSSSPLPVLAGSPLNLTCSVSVEDLLSVEPLIQWSLSDQTLSEDTGTTSTLTFDPLLTTNAAQYTCTVTINIPEVNIMDRAGSNSTDLTVNSKLCHSLTVLYPTPHSPPSHCECVLSHPRLPWHYPHPLL